MKWSSLFKIVGLAGAVGVAATGAIAVRSERTRRAYTPDEVREQLHRRLAVATSGGADVPSSPAEAGLLARFRSRVRGR